MEQVTETFLKITEKRQLKIVMACPELAGLTKTGGLGDALSGLAIGLSVLNIEVHIVLPGYTNALEKLQDSSPFLTTCLLTGISVKSYAFSSCTLHVIEHSSFQRPGIYGEGQHTYDDNSSRFALFCRAVVDLCQETLSPDIIHCHDWHTALVPYYLRVHLQPSGVLRHTRTVFTIHNAAFQQKTDASLMNVLGLAWRFFTPDVLEDHGQINLLKCGIAFADWITTVSPGYACELLTPEGSHGLHGCFQRRREEFKGILNGVESRHWNPEQDALIPARFHRADLSGKWICREQLLKQVNLPCTPGVPVYAMVSRLTVQKGFNYLLPALEQFLANPVVCIILGTGERWIADILHGLERRYAEKLRFLDTFDDSLAHKITAASDFFLIPSLFEPCGLTQMYSQLYGSLPIVRKVGGLANTVKGYGEYREQATGFVFSEPESQALLSCLRQSLDIYHAPPAFQQLQYNAMGMMFDWQPAAKEYLGLYQTLLNSRVTP